MISCRPCQAYDKNKLSGVYDFTCLDCCVRLVMSTYPKKILAESVLQSISVINRINQNSFGDGTPTPKREDILSVVSSLTGKVQR